MKIIYKKTPYGLKPCTDEDLEKERKLTNGNIYSCEVKTYRNYEFHKKYFAMIRKAWECLNEWEQELFKNVRSFRKSMEITAGHCDVIWNVRVQGFSEVPKSIAFDKMDDLEFKILYEGVRNAIFQTVLKGKISEEDFNRELINF